MGKDSATQREVTNLNKEYEHYITKLKREWLSENRPQTTELYELMDEEERGKVHACMRNWSSYITPLAEKWWKERGYGCIWPEDDSKPMQIYKLDEEQVGTQA